MNARPFTVNLYIALAVASNVAWTILRYDEVMASLPTAIAQSLIGAIVLWGVWRGQKAVWLLVVVMNGWTLIWTTLALTFESPSLELGLLFVLTAAKLGFLLHFDTRTWVELQLERARAV
jgi:hypothetical protein